MALNEAKEKVCQLENAIKKLDLIKKHLSHNATDIKSEIHSCVSHNLESLRGREVSLLGKVDEVVTLKEEALQQQQAKLNQAIGVLQTRMAFMTANSVLDKQTAEILSKFNEMDLSPEETPHIAFRADHMSLSECIMNYGRVDSNALPLPSAYNDPGKPSASLPRHVEEYEDVDHHIFHKTVEALKESGSTSKNITVTIPKLSTKMEDWLQKRVIPRNTCSSSLRPTAMMSNGTSNTLKTPSQPSKSVAGDACSLNSWLSQIKSHADLEEEHNFEIVDNSQSKKAKYENANAKTEELSMWLHKSPKTSDGPFTSRKRSENLFGHIPSDYKFWLHQSCQQEASHGDMKRDPFSHISKETSTWLRSRAYGKQISQYYQVGGTPVKNVKKEQSLISKDKKLCQWLAKSSKQEVPENSNSNNNSCCKQAALSSQTKKPAPIAFQLEDICMANELCSSLMDCLCKPNCASMREQETSGVKNPLDPTKIFNPPQLPQSQWLSASKSAVDDEKIDIVDSKDIVSDKEKCVPLSIMGGQMLSHIADISSDQWLCKPSETRQETKTGITLNSNFKHCKEEANLWLQQAPDSSPISGPDSNAQEANAKMLLNFNPSNRSLSEWLQSPSPRGSENTSKKETEDLEFIKEESEGWSICSSPSSFNIEQFDKDVKVATNYIENWVL